MTAGPQYMLPTLDPDVPCTAFSVGSEDGEKDKTSKADKCLGDRIRISGRNYFQAICLINEL